MISRPRLGGGRPHLLWALVAVLAVTGLAGLGLGIGLSGPPSPGISTSPVPAPASATAPVSGPGAVSGTGATGAVDATGAAGGRAGPTTDGATSGTLSASPPTALRIPAIDLTTTGLEALGLNPDNTVEVPEDFDRAGWYTGGPTPGEIGPAVLLGHVDSYRGPAVFFRVDELRPGDAIEVTRADGAEVRFVVDAVREYDKDSFPTDEVYGSLDRPGLRLITCGGPFDAAARSYENNVVVYASPAPAPAPAPAATPGPGQQAVQAAGGDTYAALDGITGPPTLYGRVAAVLDPATAVVEVQGRRITVSVIGVDIDDLPACARDGATGFAREMLDGQTVTLVPDPTLPLDPDAPTWPAYLVLPSQQSYTDAAIRAGWVEAGQGRYRPGFLVQQEQAQEEDLGMWGPPCNRVPPS